MKSLLIGAIAPPLNRAVSAGCLPFGAMALSSYLKQNGADCQVISTALPEAAGRISKELNKVGLLGISSMSGPYLNYAVSVAENIRRSRPGLPIVWGGPHASLMGEDLILNGLADYVIKGVGERALLGLVRSIERNLPLENVPGLLWRKAGVIKENPPDSGFDINEFPQLDYSLVSLDYPWLLSEEFPYFSSRGCPFNCSYCVASMLYNRRWYSKSVDRVVAELKQAYGRFEFKSVFFWDDNLFVDLVRLSNILERLEELDINFQWSGFCRADLFSGLDDGKIADLKRRGLKWLSIGAESGSQRMLNRLNKGINVAQIRQAVIKLKQYDIRCDLSFMGGLPAETEDDFLGTLDLVKWIKDIYPQASVRVFRFIPYPKMPILKEISGSLPVSTYDWGRVTYQNTKFFEIPRKNNSALYILSAASLYSFKPFGRSIKNLCITLLFYMAQFRFKMKFFSFPLEGMLINKIYTLASLKSLVNFKNSLNSKLHGFVKFSGA